MVPPDSFSISAPHACSDGLSGCAGGTQLDSFNCTVLSCACAPATDKATAQSSARMRWNTAFLSLVWRIDTTLRQTMTCHLVRNTAMRLDGMAAIVTGGASGLGAATVQRLTDAGCRVAVLDINPGASGIACDVADAASAEAAVVK